MSFCVEEYYATEAAGRAERRICEPCSMYLFGWLATSGIRMQESFNDGDAFPDTLTFLVSHTADVFRPWAVRIREENCSSWFCRIWWLHVEIRFHSSVKRPRVFYSKIMSCNLSIYSNNFLDLHLIIISDILSVRNSKLFWFPDFRFHIKSIDSFQLDCFGSITCLAINVGKVFRRR